MTNLSSQQLIQALAIMIAAAIGLVWCSFSIKKGQLYYRHMTKRHVIIMVVCWDVLFQLGALLSGYFSFTGQIEDLKRIVLGMLIIQAIAAALTGIIVNYTQRPR